MFKLNGKKTTFIVIVSKCCRNNVSDISPLTIGESHIPSVPVARSIGVMLDETLNMVMHVRSVCKPSYHQLHQIALIQRYLSQ